MLSRQQHHRLEGSSTEGFSTTRFNVPYSGALDSVAFVEGLYVWGILEELLEACVLGFLEEAFDFLLSGRSCERLPSEWGKTLLSSPSKSKSAAAALGGGFLFPASGRPVVSCSRSDMQNSSK